MDKYYLALGRFVDRYADVEDNLFVTLQREAGLELKEAQALFSGTRVVGAIDFIKRLHEVRGVQIPERLVEVFAQVRAITKVRDHILHSGTREFRGQLQSVNQLRAHAPRTLNVLEVSPAFMDELTADLETIIAALGVHIASRDFGHEFTDPTFPRAQAILAASLVPWRYTRP